MAMLRPTSELKDSGVKWIGDIPIEWKQTKISRCFKIIGSGTTPKSNNDSYYEGTISWLQSGDINGGVVNETKRHITEEALQEFTALKIFLPPFIAVAMYGASIANTSIINIPACTNQACCVLSSVERIAYLKYVFYSLLAAKSELLLLGRGGTQPNISQEIIKSFVVPIPPLPEQQAIADYLDDRYAKIDEIIAEATASIEEYLVYKQAIIAEVTTKGLDRSVSMKATPFVWIGNIPFHWEMKPFRYILNERNEKNNPVKSEERLSLSIDKGVTLYAEKTTNLDRFKDDFSAYKLAHKGDLVMNCMNMIVGASGVSKYYGCVSPVYYTYYDNEPDHITAKYCEYLFRSRMLMRVLHSLGRGILSFDRGEDRVNTCRLKISRNDLRSLVLPVPPIEEQREIVDYLIGCDTRIDALISEKQSLIEDLQAYKKSLIYEVVTGKRRVV